MLGIVADAVPVGQVFPVRSIDRRRMTQAISRELVDDHMLRHEPMMTGRPGDRATGAGLRESKSAGRSHAAHSRSAAS